MNNKSTEVTPGYINIPNDFLEAWAKVGMCPHEHRVLGAILREHWETYRDTWYSKPVEVSGGKLMERAHIRPVSSVYRAIRKLEKKGLIVKHKTEVGRTAYQLQVPEPA